MLRSLLRTLIATLILCNISLVFAAYPDRPIRLVVPFPAGGSLDMVARLLADRLQASMGQPVIVDNRSGATGNIGTQAVVAAAPDGYTVLMHTSALAINPWLVKTSFNAINNLAPITQVAKNPYVLVVKPSLPVKTFDEFVEYAATHPGRLTCSTYGIGSPPHLALELLKQAAKIDIVHAPYRNFGGALPDLVSGQLDCSIDTPTNVQPHVAAGTVRAIGVTAPSPHWLFADAKPIGARFPSASVEGVQLLFAPAKTPQAIITRLNEEFTKIITSQDFGRRLREIGFEPVGGSPEALAVAFKKDYERFGQIIKARNIRAD